ncbi:hypothetical protein [Burkholderia mayonis]|uniref:hypothetical protein n=1 Tax=Burkholderia mayonis TaxID=1385591 RepID=UPI00131F2C97|nr:hypothetical protein [Burkholderia mayonis]
MLENLSVPRPKPALSCAIAVFFYEIGAMEKLRAAKLACAIDAAGRFAEARKPILRRIIETKLFLISAKNV